MSKIRESARLEPCQIRIPEVCNFNPETTIGAHLGGGGMAYKKSDIHMAYGCSACHDAVDGRTKTNYSKDELELMHRQGVERTQDILIKKGLIVLVQ